MRPFRFGVVSGNAVSHAEWVSKARRAEELGYAILLVPDHIVIGIAPLTALAVAAEATSTLRVGSLVLGNDFRHPAWLAKEAATLDLLSDGRFELGMGAGYLPADYAQTGLPFDSPGTRIDRLEEALDIVAQLFTGEAVSFSGKHYRVTGLQGRPTPVQRPGPPIFVGGTGRRLLSVAARRADSLGVGFTVWRTEVADVKPGGHRAKGSLDPRCRTGALRASRARLHGVSGGGHQRSVRRLPPQVPPRAGRQRRADRRGDRGAA